MSSNVASQAELIFLYIGESRLIKRISNDILLVLHEDTRSTNTIKLSPDLKDSVIQLRFRIGTDISGGDLGWNISSISVAVPRCGGSCDDGCQDATDGCNACSK